VLTRDTYTSVSPRLAFGEAAYRAVWMLADEAAYAQPDAYWSAV
jgi:hypothetical protein